MCSANANDGNKNDIESQSAAQDNQHDMVESAYLYCHNSNGNGNHLLSSIAQSISLSPTITVKALYDYQAQRYDELSFCKHAIITNVIKLDDGWWRGDYGGQRNQWFPANFVQELPIVDEQKQKQENKNNTNIEIPHKGCIDLNGANVTMFNRISTKINQQQNKELGNENVIGNFAILIQFNSSSTTTTPDNCPKSLTITGPDHELNEWWINLQEICSSGTSANHQNTINVNVGNNLKSKQPLSSNNKSNNIEKNFKIAQELSNLIIYCRAVPFTPERLSNFTEMSSFPETKVDKWLHPPAQCLILLRYNCHQFTRVYPKGSRLDSSNYDPIKMWNVGIQMAALNYQTGDRAMQLNQAKFALQNGACGYVLKPEFMFYPLYNPYDIGPSCRATLLEVSVRVIAGRHLTKSRGRSGVISPFVEVEVVGAEFDNCRFKTTTISKLT